MQSVCLFYTRHSLHSWHSLLYTVPVSLPVIAIIGRPNVGKSTLFNRLVGERLAITSPIPGTTRDRIYHEADIGTTRVILADTGGMEFEKKQDIEADVQAQAKVAASEANIIFFVVDPTQPLTISDFDCAVYLRKSRKPILLIANKVDNKKSLDNIADLYKLGLGKAIEVSSIHNLGIPELESTARKMIKKLALPKEPRKLKKRISVAIVGKPNVGKSSILNALLGQKRAIVSHIPGTTVDTLDTPFHYVDCDFLLIDTAGLRRRGRVEEGIEKYSVLRSLQAISRADVVCLVIDCSEKISNQDLHVSEYILEAGKGLMIVVNKTDLMEFPETDQEKFLNRMAWRMDYMPWAPVAFLSALRRKNVYKIFELAKNIALERRKRVNENDFSLFTKTAVLSNPPTRGGKKIVISDGYQSGINPPTFTFKSNFPDIIHFSYKRFLENEIRRRFGFFGTVIKLKFELN